MATSPFTATGAVDEALALASAWPVPHVAAMVLHEGNVVAHVGALDHGFRLASISKPIAALAVLVACEEGIVSLDDPVGQPGCTLRHVLCHAGGYGFDGDDPIARPERRRIYSNTGIELAAGHVAAAAAMSFDAYLGEAVFAPLGMTGTSLRGSPAHQIFSTIGDTGRFVAELMRPSIISAATATLQQSVHFPDLSGVVPGVGSFARNTWGLGVEIKGDKTNHWMGKATSAATFGHFGGSGTMAWIDPTRDVAVIALTDRPFDDWGPDAIRCWAELSDAVIGALRPV